MGRLVRCPSCHQIARATLGHLSSTPGLLDCATPASSGHFISEAALSTLEPRSSFISDETLAPPRRPRAPLSEMTAFLASAQQDDEMGRLGHYRVLQVLGQGGMGVVFQAEDEYLGRQVAIKAMLPHLAANPCARERFLREACLAARLEHDHIVAIHHIGEQRGVPYIVMPLLRGESLESRLKRAQPVALGLILQVGLEVADALATAHAQGFLHRDIKPANIWLENRTGCHAEDTEVSRLAPDKRILGLVRVKVLDFGLARLTAGTQEPLTLTGAVLGTPGYMPPEQVDGEELDGRSDLFSLGCILYSLAAGQPAFPGDSVSARLKSVILFDPPKPHLINSEIPRELSTLILQLLAKKKEDRPASAAEVLVRLRNIGAAGPQTRASGARPAASTRPFSAATPPAPRSPFKSRQKILTLAGVLGLCSVAVLVAMLFLRGNPERVADSDAGSHDGDGLTGWMGWPLDAPPPAVAPFDAIQAKRHQEAWARYSGVPVEWTNSIGSKFRLVPRVSS